MSDLYKEKTSRSQAKIWLYSVVFQYEKLLDILKQSPIPNELRMLEEHFFSLSLKHSIEWLQEAERYNTSLRDDSKRFRKSIDEKLVTKVRNMREHYIEYFRGKDNSDMITEKTVEGMKIKVDASSTIILGNTLGGIEIGSIVESAKYLLKKIVQIEASKLSL
ncbi:MAG: hypothetical protein HC877_04535 [Thioploca sp.]|nr:hypothetical protein [Thioploca sp.]